MDIQRGVHITMLALLVGLAGCGATGEGPECQADRDCGANEVCYVSSCIKAQTEAVSGLGLRGETGGNGQLLILGKDLGITQNIAVQAVGDDGEPAPYLTVDIAAKGGRVIAVVYDEYSNSIGVRELSVAELEQLAQPLVAGAAAQETARQPIVITAAALLVIKVASLAMTAYSAFNLGEALYEIGDFTVDNYSHYDSGYLVFCPTIAGLVKELLPSVIKGGNAVLSIVTYKGAGKTIGMALGVVAGQLKSMVAEDKIQDFAALVGDVVRQSVGQDTVVGIRVHYLTAVWPGNPYTLIELSLNSPECGDCASHAWKACVGDVLWWFNSCGAKEELLQDCQVDDMNCKGEDCVPRPCQPKIHKGCDGNSVVWFDSCGQADTAVLESCSGDLTCLNGTCVEKLECNQHSDCPTSQHCQGAECIADACEQGSKYCIGSSIYECDASGREKKLVQSCPYKCQSGNCSECASDCSGKSCGPNGCGGSCGTCADGLVCSSGECASSCTPNCNAKECGSNGCNGSCGECSVDEVCDQGTCSPECAPSCQGKECGSNGCDGSCGNCGAQETCLQGTCESSGNTGPTCTGDENPCEYPSGCSSAWSGYCPEWCGTGFGCVDYKGFCCCFQC